jgi:hypothetical protein
MSKCPICNEEINRNKIHAHDIGSYRVYYDNHPFIDGKWTSVHDHTNGVYERTPLILSLRGLVFLDERRIETYLLLK